MASISTDKKTGNRIVQFVDPTTSTQKKNRNSVSQNTRRTIRLGKMTMREARSFKANLERLLFCKVANTYPEKEVATWIASLDAITAEKLAEWGLIEQRDPVKVTDGKREDPRNPNLLQFVGDYLASRKDVKSRTKTNHQQARGFMARFFSKSTLLLDVTVLDAKQFRAWMVSEGHSENYIRTQCKNIKMFFGAAVDAELIKKNPFSKIPTKIVSLPEKLRFVEAADIKVLLESLADIEWKVLISLARWGGLRIPSEIEELRWEHVDWANSRIKVLVPKLSRIPGKGERIIPLFPELLKPLLEASEKAKEGEIYVLPRLRGNVKNLRTMLNRHVTRAGLTPWIRPFMNMRSTRDTELAELYPLKVVSEWMGHDPKVSLEHYQQVREKHWEKAISVPTPSVEIALQTALQYPTQPAPATAGQRSPDNPETKENAYAGESRHCFKTDISKNPDV